MIPWRLALAWLGDFWCPQRVIGQSIEALWPKIWRCDSRRSAVIVVERGGCQGRIDGKQTQVGDASKRITVIVFEWERIKGRLILVERCEVARKCVVEVVV